MTGTGSGPEAASATPSTPKEFRRGLAAPGPAGGAATGAAAGRTLVAGIGNVFLGDDGFGVEVVRRLDPTVLPDDVDVADYGIRGVHLAYELLNGRYTSVVMVDAAPLDGPPGTVAIIDIDVNGSPPPSTERPGSAAPGFDAHGLHPEAVLTLLRTLGGRLERALVVGCRPAVLDETAGLSAPVEAAVEEATHLVARAVEIVRTERAPASAGDRRNAR
jgi:hydrogenase maturation protease